MKDRLPHTARMSVWSIFSALAILVLPGGGIPALARELPGKPALETRLRRPVSLLTAGDLLLVGNRRSGTITVIDPGSATVVAEHRVAKRIADMAALHDERHVLVLDDAAGKLLKVSIGTGGTSVRSIAAVPSTATKLAVAADRRQIFVSLRWAHRVLSITLDVDFETATRQDSITLPFAPHELLLVNGDHDLLVADAFGGQIAVVDAIRFRTLAHRELHGHNIRGLAISADGERLYVVHQQLNRTLADYEELHWGRLVTNAVRVLGLDEVLHGDTGKVLGGWLDRQGGIGGATGDPGAVVTGFHGVVAVAFSGIGEVVVRSNSYEKRFAVRARPEAMAIKDHRLFVANRFDDSVSLIDLCSATLVETISLGPAPEPTAAERGERLFFDARVSHDGWISCHSCHTDGHSAGLLVDTLGDGDYGAPKRVPSLLGTRDTGPWGWTGSTVSLAEQVRDSVASTMHGPPLTGSRAADLVAYLESLEAPPSPIAGKGELVSHGRELFASRGCVDCHAPPTFTTDRTFDVGLADEHNRRSFNPPSLRGVSQRGRLFHDGRAESLPDVLLGFRHQLEAPISKGDLDALLEYLRSL